MQKIVVTGPESSGKTTLAKALSAHYQMPWVEEFSRTYLQRLERSYEFSDLVEIAKGQLKEEQKYKAKKTPFIFCDTSMLVMKVWSEYKYQKVDPWICQQLLNKQYSFFFLCKPDIPWEYDPLRENPDDREKLFEIYLQNIKQLNLPFAIISGTDREMRLKMAVKHLECHWKAINRPSEQMKV